MAAGEQLRQINNKETTEMQIKCGLTILCVLVAALTSFPRSALADEPELTTVTATFDTTTNDKDHDTYLDVSVYNNRGMLIAQLTGIGGHWNDHSTNTVTLELKNRVKRSDVPAGKVVLTIHPNGNDKWEFNYHVDLNYSDGSITERAWGGKVLTQDNASLSDPWNGY